ncbi:MAG: lipoprotein [Candidatus Magnetoglobus multicellularis str. Araruama]|uniref:Lipoprotein n=1 Tax=Candidatus Magnetoglobus multicellularis str. Araruama TaxID=890399 RepID=A0A1V1NUE4_9BACT|nr:MAG: lipoprotein [Candidatus Magnetoglobus multicellularis str. Araruama]
MVLLLTLLFTTYDAFSSRIPDTNQTKCYDNEKEIPCPGPGEDFYGQDGNYVINPQSFTKLDDQGNDLPDSATEWTMVRDNVTGLIWEVKTDDGSIHDKDNRYTWYDSNPETNGGHSGASGDGTDTEDFIKKLNDSKYGGFSDWRLPSINELSVITNREIFLLNINTLYFPKTVSKFYWSSTPLRDSSSSWGINFYNGSTLYNSKWESHYVRAVRGGQCRLFGHSTHLAINNYETVTDTCTGLMWQRDEALIKMTFQDAIEYCENLSMSNYNDWRLPTINELLTIVNHLKHYPATFRDFF